MLLWVEPYKQHWLRFSLENCFPLPLRDSQKHGGGCDRFSVFNLFLRLYNFELSVCFWLLYDKKNSVIYFQ